MSGAQIYASARPVLIWREKMDFSIPTLIYQVVLLFLMMVPGYLLGRFRLVDQTFNKGVSNLVLYIAQPALVVVSYVRDFDVAILINSLWVFLFSLVAHALFYGVSMLTYNNAEDAKRRMLRFATIFSNAAFMGIPLVAKMNPAWALYASIYNITFNLFLWTVGVNICADGKDEQAELDAPEVAVKKKPASILNAIIHPVFIAAVIGLVIFITPVSNVICEGNIVFDALKMLSNLVAPLSMTVIGVRMSGINFRGFFTDKYLYGFLALRHFILPLILSGIMRLMALLFPISDEVIWVTAILASTPAATSATMFAVKYDCDAEYVSKIVATSTVLSVLSMPLVMLITTL